MARIVNYDGSEALCEIGFQGDCDDKTEVETAVTPVITLKYMQSLTINPNENIKSLKMINGGAGINRTTTIKGNHNCTANMSFWIPKDLDQTTPMEVWLLKMGVDGTDTKAESTPDTYTIPDTADQYGDGYLKVMTIEAGYNKSGSITAHKLTGCIVNSMTVHAEESETDPEVLITQDMNVLLAEKQTSFTASSLVVASEDPFRWGDCEFQIGVVDSPAAYDSVNMFDLNIAYPNLKGKMDMSQTSSTTGRRYPTFWALGGRRDISGSFRIDLTTATDNGQDLWEILYNDASGTATPTEGVTLRDIRFTMYQDATYYIRFYLHDVTIGELPEDIIGENIPSITVPFTATACIMTHTILGTATSPTNWAE